MFRCFFCLCLFYGLFTLCFISFVPGRHKCCLWKWARSQFKDVVKGSTTVWGASSGPERLEAGGEAPPPRTVYLVPIDRTPGVGFQSSRFPRPWSCQQPFVISAAGEGGFHKWHGETGRCLGKGGGSRQWLGVGARRVYSGLLLRKSSA